MQEEQVTEYRYENAILRAHGTPDMERIKKACERYLRRVYAAKAKKAKSTENSSENTSVKMQEI